MIQVGYIRVTDKMSADILQAYKTKLPHSVQDRINRKLPYKARHSILGYTLLRLMLHNQGYKLENFIYTTEHKPVLLDSKLTFSIAHSCDWICCVWSDCKASVGVDIEKINRNVPSNLSPFFSDKEVKQIQTAADFFRVWTVKEAVAKAEGSGLIISKRIQIKNKYAFYENRKWEIKQIFIDHSCIAHVAIEVNNKHVSE